MKTGPVLRLCFGLSAVLLVAGCASSTPKKGSESGYLPDYSQLRKKDCPGAGKAGGECFIWVRPRLTPDNYNAVLMERLDFFPKHNPTAEVSQETLGKIHSYMHTTMREKIEE